MKCANMCQVLFKAILILNTCNWKKTDWKLNGEISTSVVTFLRIAKALDLNQEEILDLLD